MDRAALDDDAARLDQRRRPVVEQQLDRARQRDWRLATYDAPIEGKLARYMLTQGFEYEVDFAYSDEFIVDHAFSVPLNFMRPQADIPIVPIFLNFLAPPVPPARRYHKIGGIVREIIEEWPEDLRVAVICTGHMTNGVGGP